MNVGNILKVADAIEQASIPGLGFNLGNYMYPASDTYPDLSGNECGTCACIAGWAVAVAEGQVPKRRDRSFHDEAAEFFALDQSSSWELFLPNSATGAYEALPADAARVLRNLAITGKVDWEAAMKGDEPTLPPLPASKSLTVKA